MEGFPTVIIKASIYALSFNTEEQTPVKETYNTPKKGTRTAGLSFSHITKLFNSLFFGYWFTPEPSGTLRTDCKDPYRGSEEEQCLLTVLIVGPTASAIVYSRRGCKSRLSNFPSLRLTTSFCHPSLHDFNSTEVHLRQCFEDAFCRGEDSAPSDQYTQNHQIIEPECFCHPR